MTIRLGFLFGLIFALILISFSAGCSAREENDDDEDSFHADDTAGGDDGALPAACAAALEFGEDAATFSFTSETCGVALRNATAKIAWRHNGEIAISNAAGFPARTLEEISGGYRWKLSGMPDAPQLTIDFHLDPPSGTVVMRASATAPEGMKLLWVELPSAGTAGAGVLLPAPGAPRWLMSGHDIWIQSGVQELRPTDPRIPEVNGTIFPCGNNGDWSTVCSGGSFWYGAVSGPNRTPGLLWGALRADHWKTFAGGWVREGESHVHLKVVQGTPGDERTAHASEPLPMEPIWLMIAARPAHDLHIYAEASAKEVPPPPKRDAPFGWATWYYYFADIDKDIITGNCAKLREMYPAVEPLLCQIDDGYETTFGDWDSYTDPFRDGGLEQVVTDLIEMGLMPGIWMAPLMLNTDSQTAADHLDWLLRDANGDVIFSNDGRYILDVTVQNAAEHLKDIIAAKVGDGFEYLKLDFLYGGSYEAPRADGSTSMEAYHKAMSLLREGAGDETFLLACGEPWLPSLGYFNAARDSGDIVGSFPGFPIMLVELTQFRIHSVRAAFDGVWWSNDPDNLVVRNPLSYTQTEISVALDWMAGSSNILGDNLTILPQQRIDLLASEAAEFLRGLGGRLWAVDLMDATMAFRPGNTGGAVNLTNAFSTPPTIWVRAVGGRRYVALFAWRFCGDSFEFSDYDLDADFRGGANARLIFGANGHLRRNSGGKWSAKLSDQNVAVYEISPSAQEP